MTARFDQPGMSARYNRPGMLRTRPSRRVARRRRKVAAAVVLALAVAIACLAFASCGGGTKLIPSGPGTGHKKLPGDHASARARKLALAAQSQVGVTVKYDSSYVPLKYPGGDLPQDRGACTDVLIRAFRKLGIDLQVKVHEDMLAHFKDYPQRWGATGPDSNIDHRRVENLQTYFERKGYTVPVSSNPADYWPGDIVVWGDLGGKSGSSHIGIVSTYIASGKHRYGIVHNIGHGVKIEDRLFGFKIIAHFRPL